MKKYAKVRKGTQKYQALPGKVLERCWESTWKVLEQNGKVLGCTRKLDRV